MVISATGTASSSGWSKFELSQFVHIMPPKDGVQAFSFVGKPPTVASLPKLEPGKDALAVIHNIDVANSWGPGIPLTGIRIVACSNSIEQTV